MCGRTDERKDDIKTISLRLRWGIKNKCVSIIDLKFNGSHLFFFLFFWKKMILCILNGKMHLKMHKIIFFTENLILLRIFDKQ